MSGGRCGKAVLHLYCKEPYAVRVAAEFKRAAHKEMTEKQTGFSGGNDDSFYAEWDNDGRMVMVATGSSRAQVLIDADGKREPTWHRGQTDLTRVLGKGDHTLTFYEREDGAYLRTVTILSDHAASSCRFGSSSYEEPGGSTTTVVATTQDPQVIALQEQVNELAKGVNSATADYVTSQVQLAITKLTDAYEAKIASINAERVAEEAQLTIAVQALQATAFELSESLQGAVRAAANEPAGSTATCSGSCDPVPSVSADGVDLLLSAAGGDVQMESLQCGMVSVCKLQQTVDKVVAAIDALGDGV